MAKLSLTRLRNWGQSPRGDLTRRVAIIARDGLSIIGFAVLTMLVVSTWKPELRTKIFFLRPVQVFFASGVEQVEGSNQTGVSTDWLAPPVKSLGVNPEKTASGLLLSSSSNGLKGATMEPLTREQKRVAQYLSSRYHIVGDAAEALTRSAYLVAKDYKLDPLLILAVAGIESSFNPLAASSMGAEGLMQVMTRVHSDKFESLAPTQRSAYHPIGNMQVGAQILKDCIQRGGSVDAGLRMYVGAGVSGNDGGYPEKVIAERDRIRLASGGKAFDTITRVTAPAVAPVKAPGNKSFESSYDKVVSVEGHAVLAHQSVNHPSDLAVIASNP